MSGPDEPDGETSDDANDQLIHVNREILAECFRKRAFRNRTR